MSKRTENERNKNGRTVGERTVNETNTVRNRLTSFDTFAAVALALLPSLAQAQEPAADAAAAPAAEEAPAVDEFDYAADDFKQAQRVEIATRKRPVLEDLFEINAFGNDRKRANEAITKVLDEASRIERLMSAQIPNTEIDQINKKAGIEPVKVSEETLAMIKRGIELSKMSDGAFDITWAALRNVWHFDLEERAAIPPKEEIEAVKKLINWKNVRVDDKRQIVYLTQKGMRMDIGGIAKGYAIDRAREILVGEGITDFRIKIGNSVFVHGYQREPSAEYDDRKLDKPWTVAVPDPRSDAKDALPQIPLRNQAMFTSWDNDHFFEIKGNRYHHVIDPRTGYPATGCRSVTIIADSAADADALAVAVFVLGPEKGLALVGGLKNTEAIIIDSKQRVQMSPNVRTLLTRMKTDKNIDLKTIETGGKEPAADAKAGKGKAKPKAKK